MKYVTTIGEREFQVEILDERRVLVGGTLYEVDFDSIAEQPVYSLLLDGQSFEAYVYPTDRTWQVLLRGSSFPVQVVDELEKRLQVASGSSVSERDEFHLKAPMPGLVIAVHVGEGQEVDKGDVLLILESMKMQNELKSPRAGRVARLRVQAGDSVEQHETMLSVM